MKRRTFNLGMAAGAVTIISGCGGGSSSGGTIFLKDVSGTWTETGGQLNFTMLTLVQSGKALSGTLSKGGSSSSIQMTGTKDGNAVDLTGTLPNNNPPVMFHLNETLVSGSQMSGQFGYSANGITISLATTFTKTS